jgi:MoxR-like ATPase
VKRQAVAKPDIPSTDLVRQRAEVQYAEELAALAQVDNRPKPPGWQLSPWSVRLYLLGGTLDNGFSIAPKYSGSSRLMEVAIATLATDRALLLTGVPGTAKTWVSEHLAAAISGDSSLIIQGTAGTEETSLRYGWNYARLIADGPSKAAIVPSPMLRAMQEGRLCRIEELTRMPSETQDALISLLSEKSLPIFELDDHVAARKGFNCIATANSRDRGVYEMSSALARRFHTVVLPLPATLEDEVAIVQRRAREIGQPLASPSEPSLLEEIRRVVTVFRELRSGLTLDGRQKLKSPSATLSTAEAISVIQNGQTMSVYYGDGVLRPSDLAASLTGSIVRDPEADLQPWQEYLQLVARERGGWQEFYRACLEFLD